MQCVLFGSLSEKKAAGTLHTVGLCFLFPGGLQIRRFFSSLEAYGFRVAQSREHSWCACAPFPIQSNKIKINLSRTFTRTPIFRDTFSYASFLIFLRTAKA